jgi:hypothetical protein
MSKDKLTSNKEAERLLEHDLFGTNPRKKGINSKKKGNANELECAKFLKEWTGLEFNRVPQSGGLRWKNSEGVTGDLVCEDRSFPFSVETKHYKDIKFDEKLKSTSFVFKVWDQALRDAERATKHPLVILRKNGMAKGDYMVYIHSELVAKYVKEFIVLETQEIVLKGLKDITLEKLTPISKGIRSKDDAIFGYSSKQFMEAFNYEKLVFLINS